MPTEQNPDFSLASKKLIAKAVRKVLREPDDNGNVKRPAFPRGGGGVGKGQYKGMVYQMVEQNEPGWDFQSAVVVPDE